MIAKALLELQKEPPKNITAVHLTKSLPTIWNQSVGWLNKAYNAINDTIFVKKVCVLFYTYFGQF
jgi:hypothetical protein